MGLKQTSNNIFLRVLFGFVVSALVFIAMISLLFLVIPNQESSKVRCLRVCRNSYGEDKNLKAFEICTEGCKTIKK